MKYLLEILITLFILQSCIKDEADTNNEAIFNAVWTEMAENYGGFGPRHIDWDSVYTVFHPKIKNTSSDDELWNVCISMLDILDDQHVAFTDNKDRGFSSGKENDEILAEREFRLANVLNNYLESDYDGVIFDDEDSEVQFVYGTIKDKNIGYIYFPHFAASNNWHLEIDAILKSLSATDGLIVDVRNNGGGDPFVNRFLAQRFMKDEAFIFSIQTRNGPNYTDFDEPTNYFSTPSGETYTKPTIALINHSTVSAGEEFMLYLQSQDHVTVMGSPTSNAFSTKGFHKFFSNGWKLIMPVQLYLYPDGTSPEGIGIIPDTYQVNDTNEVNLGIDELLKTAIEIF